MPSIPAIGGTRPTGSIPALDRKPPTQPPLVAPAAPAAPAAKPDLLATQRGQAPGPTGNAPVAPPPARTQRMATPVAPMPIVTRRPSPTTPPPPPPRAPVVAAPRPAGSEIDTAEPTELNAIPHAPEPETTTGPKRAKRETRKTVMGVAVVPSGVTVLPATPAIRVPNAEVPHDTTEVSADEQTSTDTSLADLRAPSNEVSDAGDVVDAPVIPPTVEEATPSGDWTMTPGASGPTIMPTQSATPRPVADVPSQPVAPAQGDNRATGDWLIALDPSRPDGWSEPSEVEKRPPGVLPPGPPVSAVSSDIPLDSSQPHQAAPRTSEAEPKVQIDPTLIEPLQPIPEELAPSGDATAPLVAYAPPLQMSAHQPAPELNLPGRAPHLPGMVPAMMRADAMPQFPAATGSNSAYPQQARSIDPQAMLQTHRVRGPSDVGDSTSVTRAAQRKRMLVTLASAGIAVVIGIVLLVVVGRGKDKPPTVAPVVTSPVAAPTSAGKAPSPGSAEVVAPIDAGAAIEPVPATTTPPPTAVAQTTCVVDVVTAPPGAEVFLEGNQIIGPSPTKVTLPCGVATKISARKKLFQTATRVIKPAPDAKKPVKLVLSKLTFSVKVSSVPAGATIMLGAKVLGVTPTNIRLNAFEPATLTIKKDGYAPETQKITPKQNNQTMTATLKKVAVKRGR